MSFILRWLVRIIVQEFVGRVVKALSDYWAEKRRAAEIEKEEAERLEKLKQANTKEERRDAARDTLDDL